MLQRMTEANRATAQHVKELERSLTSARARAEDAEIQCAALEREFRKDAERQASLLKAAEEGKRTMEARVAELRGKMASMDRRRSEADAAREAAQAEVRTNPPTAKSKPRFYLLMFVVCARCDSRRGSTRRWDGLSPTTVSHRLPISLFLPLTRALSVSPNRRTSSRRRGPSTSASRRSASGWRRRPAPRRCASKRPRRGRRRWRRRRRWLPKPRTPSTPPHARPTHSSAPRFDQVCAATRGRGSTGPWRHLGADGWSRDYTMLEIPVL